MKMSDVFELPVRVGCYTADTMVVTCLKDGCGYADEYGQVDAAAHAINMHDELVDGLDCVLTCWLEDCDPTELALVVNKAMSILTRAKGAE